LFVLFYLGQVEENGLLKKGTPFLGNSPASNFCRLHFSRSENTLIFQFPRIEKGIGIFWLFCFLSCLVITLAPPVTIIGLKTPG